MIDQTLIFLRDQINSFLMETIQSEKVVLGHLVNMNGQTNVSEIGLTLINIEQESSLKNTNPYRRISDDEISKVHPPIYLNLYVLISAYFGDTEENYKEALKNLSRVIRFFQAKPLFNHQNSAGLDPEIEKVLVELVSLTFEQQNNLWASLGGKYLPSVIYKLRLVEIVRDVMISTGPPIEDVFVNTKEMEEK
ncbi:MAG: DUF4255 domain-containing protein [Bacteroidales bacterium]|nr:DUF4255 domain-containing protein [Bacteroidales bacterium]